MHGEGWGAPNGEAGWIGHSKLRMIRYEDTTSIIYIDTHRDGYMYMYLCLHVKTVNIHTCSVSYIN